MIKIELNNDKEHIFQISYNLKAYIPQEYFNKYKQYVELYFLKDLFANSEIDYLGKQQMIWSTDYYYEIEGRKFTLSLDEDYAFVSFFSQEIEDREVIAEYIVLLIQNQQYA